MAKISCSAVNCGHNKDLYCCKPNVYIDGETANRPEKTCCDSFVMKGSGSFAGENPQGNVNVECAAEMCVFNCNGVCDAKNIVVGTEEAKCIENTECDSFTTK